MKKIRKVISFIKKNLLIVIGCIFLLLLLINVFLTVLLNKKANNSTIGGNSSESSSIVREELNTSIGDDGNTSSSVPTPDLKSQLKTLFPIRTPDFEADYLPFDDTTKPIIIMVNLANNQGKNEFLTLMSHYSYNPEDFQFIFN